MSGLDGYCSGGTIHVVVNNQGGFTTSVADARSTRYATDVTRILKIPVFHVNGEDPEAVAQVTQLSLDYRQKFGRDVCIDMYGYRKYGHNEGDEPRFTQPVMYAAIDKKPTVRQVYIRRLVEMGSVTEGEAEQIAVARKAHLEDALAETRKTNHTLGVSAFAGMWNRYRSGYDAELPDAVTAVPTKKIVELLERMMVLPDGFHANPKVVHAWSERLKGACVGTKTLELGHGEASKARVRDAARRGDECAPFGSGCATRDVYASARGVVRLEQRGAPHAVLMHLRLPPARESMIPPDPALQAEQAHAVPSAGKAAGRFEVFDSPLSARRGVLGFDYGYSLDGPDGMVIWEAQFGDFCQRRAGHRRPVRVTSAEDKWLLHPGPRDAPAARGYEGQGPSTRARASSASCR